MHHIRRLTKRPSTSGSGTPTSGRTNLIAARRFGLLGSVRREMQADRPHANKIHSFLLVLQGECQSEVKAGETVAALKEAPQLTAVLQC